jgi:hypothetical protein
VYALQRWVTACGSRSIYPVKFNGSIFTVEWREGEELRSDPDYRRWGGGYWWQNTRLPYWPLLSSGDFDLMKPLWDLYTSVIEISKVRNKVWWKLRRDLYARNNIFLVVCTGIGIMALIGRI